MDIIFKFGEHYYESSGNNFASILLVLLGSFLGFATALYIDRKARRKEAETGEIKIQDEYLDRLNYLKILVTEVLKAVKQQNSVCIKFWEAIEADPYEIQYVKIVSSNDTKRIINLDSQNSFLAFRHFFKHDKNWLKDLQEFNKSVDFIDSYFPEIRRIFENYQKGIYNFSLQYKTIVDNLPDYMDKEVNKIKISLENYIEDSRYIFLNNSISNYHNLIENKAKLKTLDSEFLEPLLLETLRVYSDQPFAESILDMCKKARVKLNDIKVDALATSEEFQTLPQKVESSVTFLEELILKIDNNVG